MWCVPKLFRNHDDGGREIQRGDTPIQPQQIPFLWGTMTEQFEPDGTTWYNKDWGKPRKGKHIVHYNKKGERMPGYTDFSKYPSTGTVNELHFNPDDELPIHPVYTPISRSALPDDEEKRLEQAERRIRLRDEELRQERESIQLQMLKRKGTNSDIDSTLHSSLSPSSPLTSYPFPKIPRSEVGQKEAGELSASKPRKSSPLSPQPSSPTVIQAPTIKTSAIKTSATKTSIKAPASKADKAPAVKAPVVKAPAVKAPIVKAPAGKAPAFKLPDVKTTAIKLSDVKVQAIKAPASKADKALAVKAPAVKVPAPKADKAPAVKAPAVKTPAVKTPASKADDSVPKQQEKNSSKPQEKSSSKTKQKQDGLSVSPTPKTKVNQSASTSKTNTPNKQINSKQEEKPMKPKSLTPQSPGTASEMTDGTGLKQQVAENVGHSEADVKKKEESSDRDIRSVTAKLITQLESGYVDPNSVTGKLMAEMDAETAKERAQWKKDHPGQPHPAEITSADREESKRKHAERWGGMKTRSYAQIMTDAGLSAAPRSYAQIMADAGLDVSTGQRIAPKPSVSKSSPSLEVSEEQKEADRKLVEQIIKERQEHDDAW